MQHHNVAPLSLNAIEHSPELIEGVVVADGNQYIRGANAQRRGAQLGARGYIELVESRSGGVASLGNTFRNRKCRKKGGSKDQAGDGGDLFGEKIDRTQAEQGDGNEHET